MSIPQMMIVVIIIVMSHVVAFDWFHLNNTSNIQNHVVPLMIHISIHSAKFDTLQNLFMYISMLRKA